MTILLFLLWAIIGWKLSPVICKLQEKYFVLAQIIFAIGLLLIIFLT